MKPPTSWPINRTLEAMEAGKAIQALEGVRTLVEGLNADSPNGVESRRLWKSFERLLLRRGYFTATPALLEESLDEIHAFGAGFDLYEVARSLSEYDAIKTECLRLNGRREFPELVRFSPHCPCGRHKEEIHGLPDA